MRMSKQALAWVGCGLLTFMTHSAQGGGTDSTVIFDGTNTFISSSHALIGAGNAGDNGGTEVRLGWTTDAFGPDGYLGNFGNSDFAPTGGDVTNPVIIPANHQTLQITALANELNTSNFHEDPNLGPFTTGNPANVRVFMTEVNPDLDHNDGGTPEPEDDVWVILKEIYVYDFNSADFGSSYTTLSANIENGWDQMTLLVDVYSDPSLYNGPLTVPTPDIALNAFAAVIANDGSTDFSPDFDTLGVFQTGFQTPTSDGVDDNGNGLVGDNSGLVDIEISPNSVRAVVPEPSSVALGFFGLASLGLLRKKRRE